MPYITMVPVSSSNIHSVGYDVDTHTLAVAFVGSGEYHYANVPPIRYNEMIEAVSPGKYFAAHVRGKYESSKIR